jgi:hypothetical protein
MVRDCSDNPVDDIGAFPNEEVDMFLLRGGRSVGQGSQALQSDDVSSGDGAKAGLDFIFICLVSRGLASDECTDQLFMVGSLEVITENGKNGIQGSV